MKIIIFGRALARIRAKIEKNDLFGRALVKLRNRFALAVICCLIYHWLEVSL